MLTVYTFTFNHFGQKTYMIYDESGKAAIVDPGCFFAEEKQTVLDFLKDNNLTLEKILFTHCHLDHAFGANFVHSQFPDIPVLAHKEESIFIEEADKHAQRFGLTMEKPPALTGYIQDGDEVIVGNTKLKAIHVPGHSPGSICYYSEEEPVVIVGDVIFQNSVGRSDLLGGDHDLLISGIKSKLLTLPDNTVVYPGHGPATTIGDEKASNPFLQ